MDQVTSIGSSRVLTPESSQRLNNYENLRYAVAPGFNAAFYHHDLVRREGASSVVL